MNVVLIQPPSESQSSKVPPLGLAYIAAVLKRNDIKTKIVDLNVENINFNNYLTNEKPDIIGISSIITNARKALQIVEQTKNVLPESFVVMGGPYPSIMRDRLLTKHNEVDATIVGEAEYAFLELAKNLHNRRSIENVDGLIFRKQNIVKSNNQSKPITPLDALPFPAREELRMPLYGENAGAIFTSRGCPQQCIFCSRPIFGRIWRGHSPDFVLKEIEHSIMEYGVTTLSVLDDNFTVDMDRAEKILDRIKIKKWGLKIYFWNGLRADHVTQKLVTKLKNAGCSAINFGVESVNPDVVSFIRKCVTLEQIENAISLTQKAGIKANVFLMIGNPGDTIHSADKIIDFVERVHVDGVHLSMATPIFGTMFWDWVKKNGHWLDYDLNELQDWPIDDIASAYPVFETADFTANERAEAYQKTRNFLEKKGLII